MDGMAKKEYIIIAAVVVILIAVFVVNKLSVTKLSVGIGKASGGTENCLISDYASFQEFAEKIGLKPNMEIDLKNKEYASYYNEEFFNKHKLGAVITHEDTSKVYIDSISIDKLLPSTAALQVLLGISSLKDSQNIDSQSIPLAASP